MTSLLLFALLSADTTIYRLVRADRVEAESGLVRATGGVVVEREGPARGSLPATTRLAAETVSWTPARTRVERARIAGGAWFVRAETLDWETDIIRLRRAQATTCDYDTPHYAFRASRATIYPEKEWISLRNVTMRIGRVPVFWTPYLGLSYGHSPLRIEMGQNDFEGIYVKGQYRYQTFRWGEGSLLLDYRSHRGWAYGIAPRLSFARGNLEGRAYVLDERDAGTRSDHRARGRYDPLDRLRLRAEYHQVSDFEFRRRYFFREYVSEEEPQNVLSASYRGRNWAGLVRGVANLNRREYQLLERLPEGRIDLFPTAIGRGGSSGSTTREPPAYLSGTLAMAALRDEDLAGRTTSLTRSDARVRIEKPFSLTSKRDGWRMTPHLEGTHTRYGEAGQSLGEAGVTFASMRSASFLPQLPFLRPSRAYVGRLRPALSLRRRWAGDWSRGDAQGRRTRPPVILAQDNLDTFGEAREISLQLDHDIVGLRPFRRLFRTSLTVGYDDARSVAPWDDVELKSTYAPTDSFTLTLDAAHDPNRNIMRRLGASLDVGLRRGEAGVSVARAEGEAGRRNLLSVGGYGRYRFTEAWEAESRFSFDADFGRLDYASVSLRRYLHDFILEFGVVDEELIERRTYRIGIGLKPLGTRTVGPSFTSGAE